MTRETKREVIALFRNEQADSAAFDHATVSLVFERTARELGLVAPQPVGVAMDASLAEMMQRLINRLMTKFTVMFDSAAEGITQIMTQETLMTTEQGMRSSLREVSKSIELKMSPKLAAIVDASAAESTGLIKRVPSDYLPQVQGDVMRSITTGNGLQDLIPALEKRNVKITNWATNVARDQTRKVYNNINKVRMQDAGVKKFEWIHSGGSNKPREFHMNPAPAGLNGGIFSFDDLPIIDENTGERGIPGQLPYCGCTMRPIIEFEDDDE